MSETTAEYIFHRVTDTGGVIEEKPRVLVPDFIIEKGMQIIVRDVAKTGFVATSSIWPLRSRPPPPPAFSGHPSQQKRKNAVSVTHLTDSVQPPPPGQMPLVATNPVLAPCLTTLGPA